MLKSPRQPSYRLYKQSGQAIVTLPDSRGNRRDVLLGPYGSPESHRRYDQVLAEWNAGKIQPTDSNQFPDLHINEVILAYWTLAEKVIFHTERKARNKQRLRDALSIVNEIYGFSKAVEFRPLALKACRQKMVERGWGREYINAQVNRVRAMFKWAASEEMIPDMTYSALMMVIPLVEGETTAAESEPVKPVADEIIEATLPFLSETVQAMVRFQRFTGCRPEEVCNVRPCDLDVSNPKCWVFHLDQHKTEHHGKE